MLCSPMITSVRITQCQWHYRKQLINYKGKTLPMQKPNAYKSFMKAFSSESAIFNPQKANNALSKNFMNRSLITPSLKCKNVLALFIRLLKWSILSCIVLKMCYNKNLTPLLLMMAYRFLIPLQELVLLSPAYCKVA